MEKAPGHRCTTDDRELLYAQNQDIIAARPKPKVALHIENSIRWGLKKYAKRYPDDPLSHITPHVLDHTFCTNMANAGLDIKSLQYVMVPDGTLWEVLTAL